MTVMLLQRSVTPQSTHSQKTATKDCSAKPSFLFLLEDKRDEYRHSTETNTTTTTTNNNNNNNNNVNNNNNNNNNDDTSKRNNARRSSSRDHVANEAASSVTSQRLAGGQDVAMRYYRLWIYACNLVLFGSAVGFAAAVSQTLLFSGDPRRHVVPGVPRAYDFTAIYGYFALAGQLGLVQLLGCIAARRLSARLLHCYWIVLLLLLFGDAIIGVFWFFQFEKMRAELRPTLRMRLQTDYGKEARFSEQWDRLQREFMCCGVTGPTNFERDSLPQTCCNFERLSPSVNVSEPCRPYIRGCEETLWRWLKKTGDLLFVLGFCVIAFTKFCFLGILRYEIREMIQKIRMLREPPPPATPFGQPLFTQVLPETVNNGSIARRTTLPNAVPAAGNASLLLQSDECNTGRHPLLANNLQDGGADSDTNSHCALILEETTPTSANNHNSCNREKSNGNNNYEMREFNRRLLLSNGASPGTGVTVTGGQSRRT